LTAVRDQLGRITTALAGRYRIERELGAGGMATVYLAEDLKHHRKVALKVLRPELAAALGPERFLREIQIAAGLHHPHILGVFDSGEADGLLYYVMPHVEGESLRGRLAHSGELPIHDAVKILVEVVDALAHAHARGVVHRDIKPDNVLLSGRHALVTDFGVAKAVSEASGRQQLTTEGIALGTPAYMAPEQAAADPLLDQRVDIYAVGVLGFELVTGRTPFSRPTAQATLAAQVTERPADPRTLRAACPPELAAILLRCLEKRPADRWQRAEELLAQLEAVVTPSGGTAPTQAVPRRQLAGRPRARALLVGGVAVVGAALAYWLWPAPRTPEVVFGRRSQVTRDVGVEYDPAISPDGRFVAYTVVYERGARIVVRQVDGSAPLIVARDAPRLQLFPVWSRDNRRLAFLSERGIEIIPALGGVARLVVPSTLGPVASIPALAFPGAWSPEGSELAYALRDTIFALNVETGARRVVALVKEPHSFAWSGDGRWIAFVSGNILARLPGSFYGNIGLSAVHVVAAGGGTPVMIAPATSANVSPVWIRDSRALLFTSTRDGGADIYAVRIDGAGRPVGAVGRVTTGLGASWISLSADGRTLAYASFIDRSNVWSIPIPTTGSVSIAAARPVTAGNQVIEAFDVAPNARSIVFDAERGGRVDLHIQPLGGGEPQPFVTLPEPEFFARFSPSGRDIAFHAFLGVRRQLFVVPAAGGTPDRVTDDLQDQRTAEWLDDSTITMVTNQSDSGYISVVTRGEDGTWSAPRPYSPIAGPGAASRDGRFVGFSRDGGLAVVPRGGGPAQVILGPPEIGNYTWPVWSDDGSRVYYLQDNGAVVGGVWSVPSGGGRPRLVVRFDDPSRPWHRYGLRVRGDRLYFTLGELECDVWTAEVSIQ
jgi:serine/threonine-protein kinase